MFNTHHPATPAIRTTTITPANESMPLPQRGAEPFSGLMVRHPARHHNADPRVPALWRRNALRCGSSR